MATIPSSATLRTMTAQTAATRPSSNHGAFMASYLWWTKSITSTLCPEAMPIPLDDVSLAAQIEAYAAARRRNAYRHRALCECDACTVWRYGEERARLAQLLAA